MGSGTNRKWWREKGSRTGRRSSTKTRKPQGKVARIKMKAYRAMAKARANNGR